MSGSFVGGALGAVIGIVVPGIGPMLGWVIGSAVGTLLDPPDVDMPRLGSLRPQTSEYGRPLPIVYGTVAIQGCVIWASDLIEVEGESGGKGGGAPTPNAYYGNFAVAICEGEATIGRIWAGPDKRLIWDGATLEGSDAGAQIRFYTGTASQEPDALIESYVGSGNAPAYRGTTYIVLEYFPLKNDGNRIPFLTVEVGNVDTSIAPEILGVWWPQQAIVDEARQTFTVPYQGSYDGIITRNLSDYTLVSHYTYSLADWDTTQFFFAYDTDRYRLVRGNFDLSFTVYDLSDGDVNAHTFTVPVGADANPSMEVRGVAYQNGWYVAAASDLANPSRITLYLIDPDSLECEFSYSADLPAGVYVGPLLATANHGDNFVYAPIMGATPHLYRLPLSSGFTPVSMGALPGRMDGCEVDPYTGFVWTVGFSAPDLYVSAHDPATDTTVYSAMLSTAMWQLSTKPIFFVPEDTVNELPTRVVILGETWLAVDTFQILRGDAPFGYASSDWVGDLMIGYVGTASMLAALYNPVLNEIVGFRDGGAYSYTPSDDPAAIQMQSVGTEYGETNTLYMGARDGSAQPHGQPLSEIVLDLSERAGLDASQVDVTDLENEEVDGFAIMQQTDVRSAVMLLAPVYYFDAVESGSQVKFVKRGSASVATIPDDDLGAYESGGEPVDPLEITRAMDEEIPDVVTVRYILEATEYDPAAKSARRLIGNSGSEATLDLPIVLTDSKAMQVADVNLHNPWAARLTYRFSLPRKYVALEPTDVITVRGITMRIVTKQQSGGRYAIQAVHEDVDVYDPYVIVTETPPPPPGGSGAGGPGGGTGGNTGGGSGGGVQTPTDVVLELA